MKTLKITVSDQTANELKRISKEYCLPMGEIVDRLALQSAHTDPQYAFLGAMEQIIISVSGLNEEGIAKVFGDLAATFFLILSPDELDEIVSDLKTQRQAGKNKIAPFTPEERLEMLRTVRDRLFPEEKNP